MLILKALYIVCKPLLISSLLTGCSRRLASWCLYCGWCTNILLFLWYLMADIAKEISLVCHVQRFVQIGKRWFFSEMIDLAGGQEIHLISISLKIMGITWWKCHLGFTQRLAVFLIAIKIGDWQSFQRIKLQTTYI